MSITDHQALYFAHDLTRRFPPDSLDRFAGAVAGAQVDLNPHQVDAALFAFSSPLSKGALLADEVGLGKTIEAGLVISQRWAERKRRILIIAPANLRKQWHQELAEKFFLPGHIMEARTYNDAIKQGQFQPFNRTDSIAICSYQFARGKASDVANTPWDLVVIDEAHRLRNVYKPNNIIANTLKKALQPSHKLLLTATPLQNSLLELFGLISIIDEHTFGDLKSFREQFASLDEDRTFQLLKQRLKPVCHRTLRRQVLPYVKYTARHPILEKFMPSENEDRLYILVSDYLQRSNLQALPKSQRTLMTLVLRKLLASSTYAIAGALATMSERLKKRLAKQPVPQTLADELDEDYEALDETAEEWPEAAGEDEQLSSADRAALEQEIFDLDEFARLASTITHNAKGEALLKVLEVAFKKAVELGGAQKAIIFTESKRTQSYLLRLLADTSHANKIVLFNGSNNDPRSREIYAAWKERYAGTDKITNSRTADMRSALVDYFRDEGEIMIATEAGAEGINLQFCSLVVNYDLPWNPQRVEQRIGRCHRYGQKHDVVVVNFLNSQNAADVRVYELLEQKFNLFEGVFGTSDEVLGVIESGVDFEKRIADIYQNCRAPKEIEQAFDKLQLELSFEISKELDSTRRKLLENFDDEVREKLKTTNDDAQASLGRFEKTLMQLTRHALQGQADFEADSAFTLHQVPEQADAGAIPLGRYELPRRSGAAHFYRLGHPLAEHIIDEAKSRTLPIAEIRFDLDAYVGKISMLDVLRQKSGWLTVAQFSVEALDQGEDHLVGAACLDSGTMLDPEQVHRLLGLPATLSSQIPLPDSAPLALEADQQRQIATIQQAITERNARAYEEQSSKLDNWADDLKVGLERDIKDMDRQIREARRAATAALTLDEKLEGQKQIKALEQERSKKRRALFDAQDEVDAQRQKLIEEIEGKLQQRTELKQLFTIRWVMG
jgi:ERCC4-related helicase